MSFYSRYNGSSGMLTGPLSADPVPPPTPSFTLDVHDAVAKAILPILEKAPPARNLDNTGDGAYNIWAEQAAARTDERPLIDRLTPYLWVPIALTAAVVIVVAIKKRSSLGRYRRSRGSRR